MKILKPNMEVLSLNQCGHRKALSINIMSGCLYLPYLSEMKIASVLRPIILSSAVCPTVPCFTTFSHKRYDFQEKRLLTLKCVF